MAEQTEIPKNHRQKSRHERINTLTHEYEDAIHPLQTIDDTILIEKIRDIIEDYNVSLNNNDNNNNNNNKSYQQLYKKYVLQELKLSCDDKKLIELIERISYIINEIEAQDSNNLNIYNNKNLNPLPTADDEWKTYITNSSDPYLYDASTASNKEKQRVKNIQELKSGNKYTQISSKYKYELDKLLLNKTSNDLYQQCCNEQCKLNINKINYKTLNKNDLSCEPLKRIELMLEVYQRLKQEDSLWRKVPISDILSTNNGIYKYSSLCNDWLHVKLVHFDSNQTSEIATLLCQRYEENDILQCHDLKKCMGYQRHYRNRTNDEAEASLYYRRENNKEKIKKAQQVMNNKEIVFQQECDKIHSFLLHSTIKYGTEPALLEMQRAKSADQRVHEITVNSMGRSFSPRPPSPAPPFSISFTHNDDIKEEEEFKGGDDDDHDDNNNNNRNIRVPTSKAPQKQQQKAKIKYIGKKEDEEWWKRIDKVNVNNSNNNNLNSNNNANDNNNDNDNNDDSALNEGFGQLVKKMGIFRYQSSHGFRTGQNRGLNHLKPKFKNIKEEVLNNNFHALSNDNWNQTLRKSKVFYQSWARHKIRTIYEGRYNDQISGKNIKWDAGTDVTLQEIVTLKLYTDFDKLQFELKKCFRWETIADIWKKDQKRVRQKRKRNNNNQDGDDDEDEKFLFDNDDSNKQKDELERRLCEFFNWRSDLIIVLNKFGLKMSDKHSKRQNNNLVLYHGVNAKMILNPTETMTFFGPLSTTSSYHVAKTFATDKGMILKITTHYPRLGVCKAFNAALISDYPEEQEWLIGFIYLRVLEVRTVALNIDNWIKIPLASIVRSIFFSINLFREQMFAMSKHLEYHLKAFLKNCTDDHHHDDDDNNNDEFYIYLRDKIIRNEDITKNADELELRRRKILTILWRKFNEFRQEPNLPQIIKIDKISNGLKPYFLDESQDKDINDTKLKKWDVSFEKIVGIFPNIKEIHFVNDYKFDPVALKKLVKQIENKKNKLEKIKFIYYEYDKKPSDSTNFFDPKELNQQSLTKLNWNIRESNLNVGYKIRLFRKKQDDNINIININDSLY